MSFLQNKSYEIKFSQNYIKDKSVASDTIRCMEINSNDLVLEIGPGKGILTEFIRQKALRVIGIEKDPKLFADLKLKFPQVTFINQDFLDYHLPLEKYKLVGNIPFGITTNILKRALDSKNPPESISFIMQREAALRFLGEDYRGDKENIFSLRYKPWFKSEIVKVFERSDFTPIPKVEIVLLNITKRNVARLDSNLKSDYLDFISYCLSANARDVEHMLKKVFSNKQTQIVSERYVLGLNSRPSELKFDQWLAIFETFMQHSSSDVKSKVKGAFQRYDILQAKQEKISKTRFIN